MLKAINLANGAVIGESIHAAFSFWSRLKGLLGRRYLAEGEGILLHPCSSIHCMGMRFPIDVVFLDSDYQVLAIRQNMQPGALASCRGADYVLELPSGQTGRHKIETGDQLNIIDISVE